MHGRLADKSPLQGIIRKTTFHCSGQSFFDRLVAAGKPKMQAVGACMRKLVMLCSGVLKSRRPFDPAYGSRIVTGQHATWFEG